MLRAFAYGWRNFAKEPDDSPLRLNWEFFAVIKGKCAPQFEGHDIPVLQSSTLWLLPPRGGYLWKTWNKSCLRAMFQVADVPEVMVKKLAGKPYFSVPITEEMGERILHLAEEVRPFYYYPDETYDMRTSHLISELCLMILRQEKFNAEVPFHLLALQRVQKAEIFYRENLHRKPTFRAVAAEVGISESQLRRHFEAVRYAPPQDIFLKLRLNEACRLLLNTTLTNDVIARHSGFGSHVDFHRAFKAKYGVTPRYWRTHTKMVDSRQSFTTGRFPRVEESNPKSQGMS